MTVWSHAVVFFGLVTVSALLWPLLLATPCSINSKRYRNEVSPRSYVFYGAEHTSVPDIGSYFCMVTVAGGLLCVFLDPRRQFDSSIELHCWVRLYSVAVTLQAFMWRSSIGVPFLNMVRPEGG